MGAAKSQSAKPDERGGRRLSDAVVQAIVEGGSDAMIGVGRDARIVLFNRAAERMFGYRAEEVLGEKVGMLMNQPGPMGPELYFLDYQSTGDSVREYWARRKDAALFPVEVGVSEIRMAGKAIYTAIVRDITDRKRLEEELRSNRRMLRVVLDSMSDGVIAIDENWELLIANPAARRILHQVPTDGSVKGWAKQYGLYLPDKKTPYPFRQFPLGRAMHGEAVNEPELFVRYENATDGTWISAEARPIVDEDGVRRGAVAVFRDITRRKRAEEKAKQLNKELEQRVRERTAQLEASNEQLRQEIAERMRADTELRKSEATLGALIESSTEAIWSIDRNYRLLVWNSAARDLCVQMVGRGLVAGDPIFDQEVPANMLAHWKPLYERALAGERFVVDAGYEIGGAMCHYLVTFNPIVDAAGVSGVTVFSKEITELKRAEERARQRQGELSHILRLDTLGEMAASLAHEINQPLTAIANYAQGCGTRIRSESARPVELLDVIDRIGAEALRAAEVIRRLRPMVRKNLERQEWFDVNDAVLEATQIMAPEARWQGVEISFEPALELPRVVGDHIQIEQVVLNLLRNGLEAMRGFERERQELWVGTAKDRDAGVEVTVRDTGRGIAAEIADKVFEPFTTTKSDGLGMGLAISRTIIEAHGGQLQCVPGRDLGTAFSFTLPVED